MTEAADQKPKRERKRRPPPPLDTAIAYTVRDAAHVSGLSRSTLFAMIKDGKIKSALVAGRRLRPHRPRARLAMAGRHIRPELRSVTGLA